METMSILWLMIIIVVITAIMVPYIGDNSYREQFVEYDNYALDYGYFDRYRPTILPNNVLKKGKYIMTDQMGRIHSIQNKMSEEQINNCEEVDCPHMFPKNNVCIQCPKRVFPII